LKSEHQTLRENKLTNISNNLYDFFYNIIFIPISLLLIKILRKFNLKLDEREKHLKSVTQISFLKEGNGPTIWFHASSMGEFEQAKPIIEIVKEKHPFSNIVVSFFSPSGFNTQKHYKFADYICYLPFDTIENANAFIQLISPDIAIFIRYDVWRNYLKTLKRKAIPALLINATQPSNKFFRKYFFTKGFIRSNMNLFTEIFTVGDVHSDYFKSLKLNNVIHTLTDTRFDRIAEHVRNAKSNLIFPEEFIHKDSIVLVAGSTWSEDENIIVEAVHKFNEYSNIKVKTVFVPHEPNQENLKRLTSKLRSFVLLSEIVKQIRDGNLMQIKKKLQECDLVVDSIGFLLRLYNYADLAYIGGAFGSGIHSVTEAAGYALPIVSGPDLTKSSDAVILMELGSLKTIQNADDLFSWLKKMVEDVSLRQSIGTISKQYIFNSVGSSKKVFDRIEKYLY
jgi:3-deoxy-D-manno-octulosonic-acid transferase